MDIEIRYRGAFGSALVQLDQGETFVSESGAMFRASSNVDIDVTTKTRGKGGIWAGIKRMVGGDSFFMSTYRADGGPGEVGLAPTLQGEVRQIDVENDQSWVCAGGSYLGCGPGIQIDTQFQGLKGLFTGESLFFVQAEGQGPLLVNAFGRITELDVDGELIVDTGHLVAYHTGMDYSISKAGGGWIRSFLAGEGLVMHFRGKGKVLVQSHNPKEFGKALGPKLPPRD